MIWIAITVFNRIELTKRCLQSILRQSYNGYKIVICDDGSEDGTWEIIESQFPDVILLKGNGDLWWTGGTNRCVRYILEHCKDSDYVLTLNNDAELHSAHLEKMVYWSARKPDSILTSVVYDIENREMPVYVGSIKNFFTTKEKQLTPHPKGGFAGIAEITHAPGYATLIPVKIFRRIGIFDEKWFPHYGADYEFTYRAAKNRYKIFVNYDAKIYLHVETTGFSFSKGKGSLREFLSYLSNRKSPAKFVTRWRLAVRYCPPLLLPSYLLIDNFLVIGSYLRFWIVKKTKNR